MRKRAVAFVVLSIAVVLMWGCARESAQQTPAGRQAPREAAEVRSDEQHQEEETGHAHEGGESAGEHLELSGEVVDGVRVVQVAAQRYEFIPNSIVVKQGQPVRLEITSQDVTHGFEVEDLGINQTLPPHETQTVEFTPEEAGEHHFHCSVYCGPGHDEMHGTLVVRE
ncbi:MAG: cupredoxin domain-containing protein [Armatimonadota bacterium]